VTQEFVNVGIAVFSKEARYLNSLCEIHYGRITKVFGKIDGERFRQDTRYIHDRIRAIGRDLASSLPFETDHKLESLFLNMVRPPDDSAFQFSSAGFGLSSDLDTTLRETFVRFVEKY
jgi:hypothetical protein